MKKVPAKMLPAVREMITESLIGWADSLAVEVQHVEPAYRGASVGVDKRNSKQNTITLRQLERNIHKVDTQTAKANKKQAEETEQARRAELYAKKQLEIGVIPYEPETDQLFMNQLRFAAVLVQVCGFDPEYFTDDE